MAQYSTRLLRAAVTSATLLAVCLPAGVTQAAPSAITPVAPSSAVNTGTGELTDDSLTRPFLSTPGEPYLISGDGRNLVIVRQKKTSIDAVPLAGAHNWFYGLFNNLPTDQPTNIQILLAGADTSKNHADVSKWDGLVPLVTYADPDKFDAYTWYTKGTDGRWIAFNPFPTAEPAYAGTGLIPEQHIVPAAVAAECLSPDGKFWFPWEPIIKTVADKQANTLAMTQKFSLSSAAVAMRIPYTYTYLQQFLARLQAAKLPGVVVDEIGTTPGGKSLPIIRVTSATPSAQEKGGADRRTILVIAREHATEHASSWAVHGLLTQLISDTPEARKMRAHITWLIVPMEDPDGSADAEFEQITDRFRFTHDVEVPPEVLAYTRYLTKYVNAGQTIDIAISIHNVEVNEAPNIYTPFAKTDQLGVVKGFNTALFDKFRGAGYMVGALDPIDTGGTPFRLFGWCAAHFGSLQLAYEVNDQFPTKRLLLPQLQQMGVILGVQLEDWLESADGEKWHQQTLAAVQKRNTDRAAYLAKGYPESDYRTKYGLLVLGF